MKNVLIVDDSKFMRILLRGTLEQAESLNENLNIMEAESAVAAFELLNKEKIDLVLLDIVMDEDPQEGLLILQQICNKYWPTKVIMISSVGQEAIKKKCFELGVDDFINKPFSDEVVVESVKNSLFPRESN